jgi:hypothetical protein
VARVRIIRRSLSLRAVALAALAALAATSVPLDALRGQGFDREVAFLLVPTGARAVGMGRAGGTLSGDLQGARWNPAVIASVRAFSPLVSSYDGPLEFRVSQLAAAFPALGLGVLAISAEVQDFGEIPLAGPASPDDVVGVITPNNMILSLGFGRSLLSSLSLGLVAKWIRSDLGGELDGSTFAFDAGFLWRPFELVPLDLGASATNLGPGFRYGGEPASRREPLPARIRVGVGYDLLDHLRPSGDLRLRFAVDLEHALRNLRTGSQFLGLELGVRDVLFVRGGWIAESLVETNTGSTVGLGLRLSVFRFDLAREMGVNQLGDETQLSLSASL